jgi:adenylate cyclase
MERRLTAILAADVVGYSRLTGTDEAGTLAELKEIRRELIDGKIAEHQGRIVKLTGDGVNVAARLESVATPGGVAVSQSVRDHVGNRLNLTFEDRGEEQFKNIERLVRVYDVVLDEPTGPRVTTMKDDRPSIAVLPFANMSDRLKKEKC